MTNKEKTQSVIKSIEDIGFHVTDVNNTNTYFLFEGEDDSICHFHIKEIPGFLFGLWTIDRFDTLESLKARDTILWCDSLNIDTKSEVIFFTQYERDLDKFKPSRSGFVLGLYRQAWEEENEDGKLVDVEEWSKFYDLEAILNYMKKHRIKSVEYAGCQNRYIWENDRSGFKIFIRFIYDWCYEYKSRFKEWSKYKKALRVSKRYMNKLKQFNYIIVDEGKYTHPRIDILVRRKDIVTDVKQYDKDWDIIDKFNDKFFNILSINWRQYGTENLSEEELKEVQEKDNKERDLFFWYCDKWINNKMEWDEDSKLIAYSVEKIPDLDDVIKRREEEIKNI